LRARYTGSNNIHEWLLFFSIVFLIVLFSHHQLFKEKGQELAVINCVILFLVSCNKEVRIDPWMEKDKKKKTHIPSPILSAIETPPVDLMPHRQKHANTQ
jgi:hypothetical protein